ncbi:MAG: electron transfer flavoprotein subunit beta/FixA family protein [Spirochaetota bacterium]|nr:MAG: electron transfer flavoprotein subunit beta/FixA family protein [Spirochaetota bacterium]
MGLEILVCMKQVPDTQKVKIDPERGTLIRKGVPSIMNPFDESALELALEIKEAVGGRITVLSMGIPDAECILRDSLTLGAEKAYLLTKGDFAGADTLATSYTISRAIKTIGKYDLLLFGKQAIDGDTAQVGPEVSAYLDLPVVTFVSDVIKVEKRSVVVERMIDNGKQVIKAPIPSVLTVVKARQRLRIPTIDGIVSSFERNVVRLGPDDIGADIKRCGLKGSPTRVKKIFSPEGKGSTSYIEGNLEQMSAEFIDVLKHKGLYRR